MALRQVSITPTLGTNPYAVGNQMSTLQTVNGLISMSGVGGKLTQVRIVDKAAQKSPLDLVFFRQSVTVAADQAASNISDADMANAYGVVNVLAGDYDDESTGNSIATVALNPPLSMQGVGGGVRGRVWLALICRGTPTYAASDLVIELTAEGAD